MIAKITFSLSLPTLISFQSSSSKAIWPFMTKFALNDSTNSSNFMRFLLRLKCLKTSNRLVSDMRRYWDSFASEIWCCSDISNWKIKTNQVASFVKNNSTKRIKFSRQKTKGDLQTGLEHTSNLPIFIYYQYCTEKWKHNLFVLKINLSDTYHSMKRGIMVEIRPCNLQYGIEK